MIKIILTLFCVLTLTASSTDNLYKEGIEKFKTALSKTSDCDNFTKIACTGDLKGEKYSYAPMPTKKEEIELYKEGSKEVGESIFLKMLTFQNPLNELLNFLSNKEKVKVIDGHRDTINTILNLCTLAERTNNLTKHIVPTITFKEFFVIIHEGLDYRFNYLMPTLEKIYDDSIKTLNLTKVINSPKKEIVDEKPKILSTSITPEEEAKQLKIINKNINECLQDIKGIAEMTDSKLDESQQELKKTLEDCIKDKTKYRFYNIKNIANNCWNFLFSYYMNGREKKDKKTVYLCKLFFVERIKELEYKDFKMENLITPFDNLNLTLDDFAKDESKVVKEKFGLKIRPDKEASHDFIDKTFTELSCYRKDNFIPYCILKGWEELGTKQKEIVSWIDEGKEPYEEIYRSVPESKLTDLQRTQILILKYFFEEPISATHTKEDRERERKNGRTSWDDLYRGCLFKDKIIKEINEKMLCTIDFIRD